MGNDQCDQTQDGVEEGGDQVDDVEVVPVRIIDDDGCNETGEQTKVEKIPFLCLQLASLKRFDNVDQPEN